MRNIKKVFVLSDLQITAYLYSTSSGATFLFLSLYGIIKLKPGGWFRMALIAGWTFLSRASHFLLSPDKGRCLKIDPPSSKHWHFINHLSKIPATYFPSHSTVINTNLSHPPLFSLLIPLNNVFGPQMWTKVLNFSSSECVLSYLKFTYGLLA